MKCTKYFLNFFVSFIYKGCHNFSWSSTAFPTYSNESWRPLFEVAYLRNSLRLFKLSKSERPPLACILKVIENAFRRTDVLNLYTWSLWFPEWHGRNFIIDPYGRYDCRKETYVTYLDVGWYRKVVPYSFITSPVYFFIILNLNVMKRRRSYNHKCKYKTFKVGNLENKILSQKFPSSTMFHCRQNH